MGLKADIDAVTAAGERNAGGDAEARAADHVRDRLLELGRPADVERVKTWPRWALAQAVVVAIALVGSVVSVSKPGPGLAIVLLAALASIAEATGAATLASRLTGSRRTPVVWSPGAGERPGLLLLVASADAPRDALFHRIARRVRDPWLIVGGSMLVVLACCALRILGFGGTGLTAVQFVPTLVLLAAVALLVDVELSPTAPGNAQAAGAATVVALAEDLAGELRYLEVAVLVAGGRAPFAQGMRGWLARHRKEIDPRRTVVLAVDALGAGGVRYTRREGPRLLSWKTSGEVAGLCADIAEDDSDGAAFDAAPVTAREVGNAGAALSRGIPAIGVTTADVERLDLAAVERARAFCAELARRIDAELAPRLDQEPLRPA